MNICYLIDVSPEKFKGGGQLHLTNLIRQIQVQNPKFKVQNFSGPSPNILIRLLWTIWVIPQVVIEHLFRRKFDLIHAHSIPAMVSGKILSLILKIPVAVTVHGYNGNSWMEKLVATKIKYAAQITVARNFLEIPNINKNVIYIPNGVDGSIFRSSTLNTPARLRMDDLPDQTSSVRSQAGVQAGGQRSTLKTILFVGRKSDPVKGFKILEQAMELVKQEIPNAKLLIAGGDLPEDKVLRLYQEADLFVLPSLSEGFPLTLLEAWMEKLPVVATKVGDLPYLIQDGFNGYLADPGLAHKLSTVIIKALKNRDLAKLGKNGYNLAKRYTWSLMAGKTLKVYNGILLTH